VYRALSFAMLREPAFDARLVEHAEALHDRHDIACSATQPPFRPTASGLMTGRWRTFDELIEADRALLACILL